VDWHAARSSLYSSDLKQMLRYDQLFQPWKPRAGHVPAGRSHQDILSDLDESYAVRGSFRKASVPNFSFGEGFGHFRRGNQASDFNH
jgi:hypothetical protein